VFLLGPLRRCAEVALRVEENLRPIGLELNHDESVAHVPKWAGVPESSTKWEELKSQVPCLSLTYEPQGIKVVGIPFGTEKFIQSTLIKKVAEVEEDLPAIAQIPDGVQWFQVLRMCENTK
jgi:hypothetical protein